MVNSIRGIWGLLLEKIKLEDIGDFLLEKIILDYLRDFLLLNRMVF